MNKLMRNIHYKAYLTNFELACEAGIIALLADLIWLIHDILSNGLSISYCIVASGLISGILITLYALIRHHKYYTHRLIKKLIKIKRASKK